MSMQTTSDNASGEPMLDVNVTPLMKEGKLRAFAVSSRKRSALVPDLPTLAESGLPARSLELEVTESMEPQRHAGAPEMCSPPSYGEFRPLANIPAAEMPMPCWPRDILSR